MSKDQHDFDLVERFRQVFGEREPYEMRVTEIAHRLGETGGDEPDIDAESLDLALGERCRAGSRGAHSKA